MRIGIIGAGFGGCASAIALARDGHAVTLLEAVEAPRPIGAGIMLQPSGLLALATLGLLAQVLEHGEPCARLRCVTRAQRTVFDLPYDALRSSLFGTNRTASLKSARPYRKGGRAPTRPQAL